MIVRNLIKILLDHDPEALVFALTKQGDIRDVMSEKVPEVLVGTINEDKIIVLASDFEKFREEESSDEESNSAG